MALAHSSNIVTNGMVLCMDAANIKSYPGSGNTWFDIKGGNDGTATTLATTTPTPGTVIDHNTSTMITCTFTPIVNKALTVSYLGRPTGTPVSNYRGIWRLQDTSNIGFIYSDSRTTASPYILNALKDDVLSAWTTQTALGTADWANYGWWVIDMTWDGDYIRAYRNGALVATTALNVVIDTRLAIDQLYINNAGSNVFEMQHFKLYDRALSDAEVLQNFNAIRGRAGL